MAADVPVPPRSRWEVAAIWLTAAVPVGVVARLLFASDLHRQNVYLKVLAPAAEAFRSGSELYLVEGGFRYPPLAAALLVPFAACGPLLGSVLWRVLMFLVLVFGIRAVLRRNLPMALSSRERAWLLLVLLPATAVNVNMGQPNVLLLGALLWASAALLGNAFAASAIGVTAATVFKVYPLAYGMVLATLRPRLLAWLLPLLAVALLLPFVLQPPGYVREQYAALFELLRHEDRTGDLSDAYRDLRLLAAAAGAPMPATLFVALQIGCGGGIVALCWLLRRVRCEPVRLLEYAFSLTMGWFMLLGPSTEKATYLLLAPTLAWGGLAAWRESRRGPRVLWATAVALYVVDHVLPGASRQQQALHPWLRCALPAAAVLAVAGMLARAVLDLRRRTPRAVEPHAAVQ